MENYETVDYGIFENFTNRWKEENDSEILKFALGLLLVSNFLMSSFIVGTIIVNQ